MKGILQSLFLGISLISFAQSRLVWKDYYSYNQIVAVDAEYSKTFYATENSVIFHNDISNEKQIYNSVTGLRLADITALAYSPTTKKIIVGNIKGQLAVINTISGDIQYLYDISNKNNFSESQKKINKIVVKGSNAYIATGYGVSNFLLESNTFGDTYYLGTNGNELEIKDIAISNQHLFVIDANNDLRRGKITDNLVSVDKWSYLTNDKWQNVEVLRNELYAYRDNTLYKYNGSVFENKHTLDGELKEITAFGIYLTLIFDDKILVSNNQDAIVYNFQSTSDLKSFSTGVYKNATTVLAGTLYNGLYNIVSKEKISPKGPYANEVIKMRNSPLNELWFLYGGHKEYNPYPLIKAPISFLRNNHWEVIPATQHDIPAVSDISFPPNDKNRAYITSYHSGIIEVKNIDKAVSDFQYTFYNSEKGYDIPAVHLDNSVRVLGVSFDSEGNGWFSSALASKELVRFDKNHNFSSYDISDLITNCFQPVVDKNNTKWIATGGNGLYGFSEKLSNKKTQIIKEHGLAHNSLRHIAVDRNNQLWIGGYQGLRILSNVNQFQTSNNLNVTNVIIEDNGIGAELFQDRTILQIKVDGANNKWISVADAGVFYVSSNGQETFYHFHTDNSPLPNNNVHSIEINEHTGEVFFGTQKGVVSFLNYISSAPKENLEEVFAYPNPINLNYEGEVKIGGLMSRSIVKIADVSGNLVYETTASGGTITWDMRDFYGNKVSSGVYTVFVSNTQGQQVGITKIAIVK